MKRVFSTLRFAALLSGLFGTLAPSAAAGDWYVDAVNGNDANGGTSSVDAWRTLTWALAQTGASQPGTIHVSAGTYNAAHGEVFPLRIREGKSVIGVDRDSVNVEGTGSQSVFDIGEPVSQSTSIERMSVRNGTAGLAMGTVNGLISATLRDLVVEQCNIGVYISVHAQNSVPDTPTLERVVARQCNIGLAIMGSGPDSLIVQARDCSFVQNYSFGVRASFDAQGTFERCRMSNNGVGGLDAGIAHGSLSVTDCELGANGNFGLRRTMQGSANSVLEIVRSTVARNHNSGLEIVWHPEIAPTAIHQSIFDNDVVDFLLPTQSYLQVHLSVINSLIRGGQFTGANGNFSADPLFRNDLAGDYRLSWSSPCIDAAPVQPAAGTLDIDGHPRDIDGDLDTLRHADLGAFEFQPLELSSSGAIGTPLQLTLSSSQGAYATVYWTHVGLSAQMQTLFGTFELDPLLARSFRRLNAPAVITRMIPNSPALVGHTFAFQALVDSPVAPLSRAFTNGVEVLITP